MYHIFALTANCVVFFRYGAENILITNPRDMKKFCKDLQKNPFSIITGVNTLIIGLLNQDAFKNLDFSKLKTGAFSADIGRIHFSLLLSGVRTEVLLPSTILVFV